MDRTLVISLFQQGLLTTFAETVTKVSSPVDVDTGTGPHVYVDLLFCYSEIVKTK